MTNLDLSNWQTRKWETRSGCPVRILAIDAHMDKPVIGLIGKADGAEALATWTLAGNRWHHAGTGAAEFDYDLVPAGKYCWVNLYQDRYGTPSWGSPHYSEVCAMAAATLATTPRWKHIATVKIPHDKVALLQFAELSHGD